MGFETEPQNYSASSTKPVDGFQHHVFVRRQMWFAFNRPGHLNHWQKNKRQTTVQRSTWSGSRGTESETPYHYKKGSLFKIRAAVLDFARNRSWTAGAAKPNRYRILRPMYRKGSTGRTRPDESKYLFASWADEWMGRAQAPPRRKVGGSSNSPRKTNSAAPLKI